MSQPGKDKSSVLSLTEEFEREASPLQRLWFRLSAFLRSKQGFTWSLGLLLFLGLMPLLSLSYLNMDPVAAGGIASTTINAPKQIDVVDVQATRSRKEEARSSVSTIFRPSQQINQTMKQTLKTNVEQLEALFRVEVAPPVPSTADSATTQAEASLPLRLLKPLKAVTRQSNVPKQAVEGEGKTRRESFAQLLGETEEAQTVFAQLVKRPTLTNDPTYWERMRLAAELTLERLIKRGLTVEEYFDSRDKHLEKALPNTLHRAPEEQGVVKLAVLSALQPNRLVDEEAMHLARTAMVKELKPVVRTYRKGEPIIRKGEVVTSVQRSALQRIGIAVDTVNWGAIVGVGLVCFIFSLTLWLFLFSFEKQRFFKPSYAGLVVTLLLSAAGLLKFHTAFLTGIPLYAFPLGAFSLLISILTHSRIAILTTALWIFLVGLCLHLDFYPLSALLLGSLTGIFLISRRPYSNDRKHLMLSVLGLCIVNSLVIIAVHALNHDMNSSWAVADLLISLTYGLLGGLLSGVLTMGFLPFLEAAFRLLSPYRLLELANHDQPLLRKLQYEAPGTFHHSLMLASLSEAAAEAIGANPLLTRVGCLYHDIGKTKRPLFFIENQAYFGSDNPHDRLTPRLSKLVITSHPKDSIDMGKAHGLPEQIMAFMTEHHGTLMCGYFYQKALKEEGPDNVQKAQFRYAGPKPQTRETAIVMLADAAESAVRALKAPTMAQIDELLTKLFKQRIDDGQFDQCPITFKDVSMVKETFLRVLMGIQHNRIDYQDKIMKEFGPKGGAKKMPPSQSLEPIRPAEPIASTGNDD